MNTPPRKKRHRESRSTRHARKRLRDRLISLMSAADHLPLDSRGLEQALELRGPELRDLSITLDRLVEEGAVVQLDDGRYALTEKLGLLVGEIEMNPEGFGFVIPDKVGHPDIHVPRRWTGGAMHKDRVVVRPERWRGERVSGRVVRIASRFHTSLMGEYEPGPRIGVVRPMDPHIQEDIFIPAGEESGASSGSIVHVEILEYPTDTHGSVGRITRVLGKPGDPGIETAVVITEYNLRESFPRAAKSEAMALPSEVRPGDRKGRSDLRHETCFTIDGEDARDFDDAVGLRREGRHWILSVHIADVSHYVRPGSALDMEARERGTSVYFPDRVLPMLPEALSNGLCSLRPNVDRLAMTCEIRFTSSGRVSAARVFPSVIHSRYRLTYTEVASILGGHDDTLRQRYADITETLEAMARLAMQLRGLRLKRGSLAFVLPEAKVILDKRSRVVDIHKLAPSIAHQLIEEFMIAANEAVARMGVESESPFVYRIHERPDESALETLSRLAAVLGLPRKTRSVRSPKAYQQMIEHVAGRSEEYMVTMLLLRTMKQARYHDENVGHFGLASQAYTHFTSPIRRYPDLLVHRLLKDRIGFDEMDKAEREALWADLGRETVEASRRERIAEEAEREVVAWKKVQFMADKVGEVYQGLVTGVAAFGFFVELTPHFVEGMVRVSSLLDDYYRYEEDTFSLVGSGGGKSYRIGDTVEVVVHQVDLERRRVNLRLASDRDGQRPSGRHEPPRARKRRDGQQRRTRRGISHGRRRR